MARDPCQPPPVVLSTVQPSSHRCQNLVSHGSQWAAQIAASCGHAVLAASRHVERKALPLAFSAPIGSTTSASCPWGHRHVIRPAPNNAHNQCRRIRRAKPQVSGFNAFEEPSSIPSTSSRPPPTQLGNVLLNDTAFRQLHQDLCWSNGAKLAWGNCCGIYCPGSGFLRPQSSGAFYSVPSLCEVSVPSLREHLQRFQSQTCCSRAMWACCDGTSSDDDEHNTDNTLLLLFADAHIAPALPAGLSKVDELMIVLGCRYALDIFTIAQQNRLPPLVPVEDHSQGPRFGLPTPPGHGYLHNADSDLMHRQYRLLVLQSQIIAAACGRFHALILQEASDHVLQVSDQFIAHTGDTDLAILLNKEHVRAQRCSLCFSRSFDKQGHVGHDCSCGSRTFATPFSLSGTTTVTFFALSTFTMLWPRNAMPPLTCSDDHMHT